MFFQLAVFAATYAPGSNDAATSRSFSSRLQRRRLPPPPVITSNFAIVIVLLLGLFLGLHRYGERCEGGTPRGLTREAQARREFERIYAEDPGFEDVAERLGL